MHRKIADLLEIPFKESWILGHFSTCLLPNLGIPKGRVSLYHLNIASVIDYATAIRYINEVHQAQDKHIYRRFTDFSQWESKRSPLIS